MFRNPIADGLIVLIIVLLFFAPKRLPMLGRGVGEGIKEFKEGITGSSESKDQAQLTSDTGDAAGASTSAESGPERPS
jgi:sec-independent protein translocase protein TatA